MSEAVVLVKDLRVVLDEKIVLDRFSLSVDGGEFCYLVGETGSGKSTFLRVLYGDCPYDSGSVNVCGIDVKKISTSKLYTLRRKMGLIFDDLKLFQHKTVIENLLFVLQALDIKDKGTQQALIEEVSAKAGITDKLKKMVYKLSAGEQQRVAIARSLLNTPAVILADEPTGNLDPKSSVEVVQLLHSLAQSSKITILMSTHDTHVVNQCPARVEQFGALINL